jgi:hypothetical protein
MAAVTFHNFDLVAPGRAEHLIGIRGSSALLATLGIKPAIGRDIVPSDDLANAAPVVLISDRLWRERIALLPVPTG